jgi:ribosome biogenesis GTPase
VGDWVAVRSEGALNRVSIHAILPRQSTFSRRAAGDPTVEQVIAANVDTIFLVSGLDRDFNLRRIERYLVLARQSGATPVIVLNKIDKCDDVAGVVTETEAMAQGIAVHAVCTKDGRGFEALEAYLGVGRTVALLGSSGVGKSSIINRLLGEGVLKTAEVRTSDSRGRHTSVHRHLVVLPRGGLLIDTPGMRELQLFDVADAVEATFPDIEEIGAGCRFRNCRHDQEPGCAVKHAVAEGRLDVARYENFIKLYRERLATERRMDEKALLDAKRQSKVLGRAQKVMYKDRGR